MLHTKKSCTTCWYTWLELCAAKCWVVSGCLGFEKRPVSDLLPVPDQVQSSSRMTLTWWTTFLTSLDGIAAIAHA
jgi:hypothetical protein